MKRVIIGILMGIFSVMSPVQAAVLEDQHYTISNSIWRFTANDMKEGSLIEANIPKNIPGQKYFFSHLGNDVYKITTLITGRQKALTAKGNIIQEKYTGANNQKWKIVKNKDDTYTFTNVGTGKNITFNGNKQVLTEEKSNNAKSQNFIIMPLSEKFTVTFRDGDNTLGRLMVKKGEKAKFSPPTKKGYDFMGWDDDSPVTKNKTLNAVWKIKTYTVTFTDGSGKTLKTQTVEYEKAATPPTNPTKSGYVFDGWDKTFNKITGNLTVNAKWKINKYTVTFTDGLGKTLKTQTVEYLVCEEKTKAVSFFSPN